MSMAATNHHARLTVPTGEMATLQSLLTLAAGRIVHAAGPFAKQAPEWAK